MLSCKDITEKANDYLDKDLPFPARVKVRMHLFMCVHCRRYVEQLKMTVQTIARMTPADQEPINNSFKEELVARFKQESQEK
jgi:hypothetical protein